MAVMRAARRIDSQAARASQQAPFQFLRWLAALAAVLVNWVQNGTSQSAIAYLPVLTVVAVLLLPDADSIGVASLRFERLTHDMARQKQTIDGLCDAVSVIHNSLIAGSQVNITLGGGQQPCAPAGEPGGPCDSDSSSSRRA